MLIDQIKKANMVALKNKDTDSRAVYSIVMNKYLLESISLREKGKEIGDQEMIAIIMKTLKELADEKENFAKVGRNEKVASLANQEEILRQYLPKMLSEEEIKEEISKLDDKSIPSVMKHFKANFAGKVDMAVVNKIARSI